mgnify:CR=1 FL=1
MSLNESENNNTLNFSSKQAGVLENECETFVMKIEREKINFRLCEERYQKHLATYNKLSGKESSASARKEKDGKAISNKEKFNKKINDGKDGKDLNNIKNTEKIDRDHDLYANESEKVK